MQPQVYKISTTLPFICTLFSVLFCSCANDNDPATDPQPLYYSEDLNWISSATVRDEKFILIDCAGENLSIVLLDESMNTVHKNETSLHSYDHVFHPFPNVDVLMKSGDYTVAPIETSISNDHGKTFTLDYSFEPEWGDWWLGYIPIDVDSYLLHAGSDWTQSKIIRIDDGVASTEFQKVLEGYSLLQGFNSGGKLHVIANEVTNTQPTGSPMIYYFSSPDMGTTWGKKHSFGELTYQNAFGIGDPTLRFRQTEDNTLFLYCRSKDYDFRSFDNGDTWTKQNFSIKPSDVQHFSKTHAYALANNTLYTTTDGGVTWKVKVKLKYAALSLNFINESIGVVYSTLYVGYTNDGGATWKFVTHP